MTHQLIVTEEELSILDQVLRQEIDNTRNELRRTRNPEYRDAVHHRMTLAEHMLELIGQASAAGHVPT